MKVSVRNALYKESLATMRALITTAIRLLCTIALSALAVVTACRNPAWACQWRREKLCILVSLSLTKMSLSLHTTCLHPWVACQLSICRTTIIITRCRCTVLQHLLTHHQVKRDFKSQLTNLACHTLPTRHRTQTVRPLIKWLACSSHLRITSLRKKVPEELPAY